VFSYTQAECIVRYKRMRGFNVFYPFGFDGNGLPTERLAEQEHGVRGKDLPRPDFVRLCLETSKKYATAFEGFMRTLGISADWSLAYSTIDERCIRISQRGFIDLWKKGHAYLKCAHPVVHPVRHGARAGRPRGEGQGGPVHDPAVRPRGRRQPRDRDDAPGAPAGLRGDLRASGHPRARELLGRRALVPLQGRSVAVLADEKADPKGTGLVMCCTFGDKTDVEWFHKHGLELRQAIALDGTMTALAGPETGLLVNKARKAILERLTAAGHVTGSKEIVHPVNTHERCKTDIQYLPTKQVYVRLLDKKAELAAQGEKVRWLPSTWGSGTGTGWTG
jgi:valyl-tRNA synthetase